MDRLVLAWNLATTGFTPRRRPAVKWLMQRKVFWTAFTVLGLIADFALPLWWALAATVPIGVASWWLAYRSEWF
jgi:hypothetical protein